MPKIHFILLGFLFSINASGQVVFNKYLFIDQNPVFIRSMTSNPSNDDLFILSDRKDDSLTSNRLYVSLISSNCGFLWNKEIVIVDSIFNLNAGNIMSYANPLISSSGFVNDHYYILFQKYDNIFSRNIYYFLIYIDQNGNVVWTRRIKTPGSGGILSTQAQSVIDANQNIVIYPSIYDQMMVISFDLAGNLNYGNFLVDTTLTQPKNPSYDIIKTADNNLLATGKADSNIVIVKLSNSGNIMFSRKFNGIRYYRPYRLIENTSTSQTYIVGHLEEGVTKGFIVGLDSLYNIDFNVKYSNGSSYTYFTDIVNINGNFNVLSNNASYGSMTSFVDTQGNFSNSNLYQPAVNPMPGISNLSGGIIGWLTTTSNQNYQYFAYNNSLHKVNGAIVSNGCRFKGDTLNMELNPDPFIVTNNIFKKQSANLLITNPNITLVTTPSFFADSCGFSYSLEGIQNEFVELFPNPSITGEITIHSQSDITLLFKVFDSLGRMVNESSINANGSIQLELNNGLYYCYFYSSKMESFVKKIIVSKF